MKVRRARPPRASHRRRQRDLRAQRGRDAQQHRIQRVQRLPIRLAARCPLAVHGLDLPLDLKATDATELASAAQVLFTLRDQSGIPAPRVLLLERHELTRRSARAGARP
jgi:hypothetical protein